MLTELEAVVPDRRISGALEPLMPLGTVTAV
jgi:hypothetical protein